jgi:hypothetical protein
VRSGGSFDKGDELRSIHLAALAAALLLVASPGGRAQDLTQPEDRRPQLGIDRTTSTQSVEPIPAPSGRDDVSQQRSTESTAPTDDALPDIAEVTEQIKTAESEASKYTGGMIKTLIDLRLETLRVTKALLEQYAIAHTSGAKLDYTLKTTEPDQERADQLLQEIVAATKERDRLRSEAEKYSGGLVQSMALVSLSTQEQTLAMLHQGYYVAKYGLALTTPISAPPDPPDTSSEASTSEAAPTPPQREKPEWADPAYPDIDYSASWFASAHTSGARIHGGWIVNIDQAEIDSSTRVTAILLTDPTAFGSFKDPPSMVLACQEGQTAVVFNFDEYLLGDNYSVSVEYRIDEEQPISSTWNLNADSKATGLWGSGAISFARKLMNARTLYVRVAERSGSRHDGKWDLRGLREAADYVADACGWAAASLDQSDLLTIQKMLKSAGFYSGALDGSFGPKMRAAIVEYQKNQGLQVTGTLNASTLKSLGWSE